MMKKRSFWAFLAVLVSILTLGQVRKIRAISPGSGHPNIDRRMDFHGGEAPNWLSDKIGDNMLADSNNIWTDQKQGITRRGGMTLEFTSGALKCTGLWPYKDPNGKEWLIKLDSGGMLYALDATTTTTIFLGTMSVTKLSSADQGLGAFWITNQQDGLSFITSISSFGLTRVSSAPLAGQVQIFRNRVCLADVANQESSLILSGYLNGTDYAYDSNQSTSAMTIPIGGVNDGRKVYWIKLGIDELVIAKDYSLWALYGNDQRDFQIRNISNNVGSIYPQTPSLLGVNLYFLSNHGLETYIAPAHHWATESDLRRISDPVQNLFQNLISVGDKLRSFEWQTQADWQNGVSSPSSNISATLVPGTLRVASQLFQDQVTADFGAGTFDPNRISTANNQIQLSTGLVFFDNWNDGDYTQSPVWTPPAGSPANAFIVTGQKLRLQYNNTGHLTSTGTLRPGITFFTFQFNSQSVALGFDVGCDTAGYGIRVISNGDNGASGWLEIFDVSNNLLSTAAISNIGTSAHTVKFAETDTGQLRGYFDGTLLITTATDGPGIGPIAEYVASAPGQAGNFSPNNGQNVDISSITQQYGTPQQFISRTFNATTSSYTWTNFNASSSTCDNCTFGVQISTDGTHWNPTINQALATKIATNTWQYIRYVSTLAMNNQDSVLGPLPSVQTVSLGIAASGYYDLNPIFVGNNITSWGLFQANQTLNNGTITYRVQTASSPDLITDANYAGISPQSLNANIWANVNSYIGIRATFDSNQATITPTITNLTINWDDGGGAPNPAGQAYQDRYYIWFSTSVGSTAYNNRAVVLNRNSAFDQFNAENAGAATVYKNKLMVGDPLATGNVYSLETSTDGTDNGQAVQSFVKFKRFDGGDPDAYKDFDSIYLTISRDDITQSSIFKVEYQIDNSSTVYLAGDVEVSTGITMNTCKVNLPLYGPNARHTGKFMDVKVTELTSSKGYNIHGARVYETVYPPF